jgi:hypothetical protein
MSYFGVSQATSGTVSGTVASVRRGRIGMYSRIDIMPVTDMHFSNRSCLASFRVGDVLFRRDHFLTSAPVSGVFEELRKDSAASVRIFLTDLVVACIFFQYSGWFPPTGGLHTADIWVLQREEGILGLEYPLKYGPDAWNGRKKICQFGAGRFESFQHIASLAGQDPSVKHVSTTTGTRTPPCWLMSGELLIIPVFVKV